MDLKIGIERFAFGRESTLGEVFLDGFHECFSLEDERRRIKIKGETCIPTGRYCVTLRTEGGLHKRYLSRFPHLHKGMLWLRDVPNFQYIYIHIGNDEGDTDGCPLVGRIPVMLPDGELKIASSTDAYVTLYKKVITALENGRDVYVEVTERAPR